MRFQITAPRVPSWGFVCLNSILRYLLSPFLVVVSTELVATPLASGPLNAKLCLVNTAVCLDTFYKLSLLKFNAASGGNEGLCHGRAEGGSWGVSESTLQCYLHSHKEAKKKCFSYTHRPLCLVPLDIFDKRARKGEDTKGPFLCAWRE